MSHVGVVLVDLDDECGGGFWLQGSFKFSDPRIGFSGLWHDSPTPRCTFTITIDCCDGLPAFVRIAVAICLFERCFRVHKFERGPFTLGVDRVHFDLADHKISISRAAGTLFGQRVMRQGLNPNAG